MPSPKSQKFNPSKPAKDTSVAGRLRRIIAEDLGTDESELVDSFHFKLDGNCDSLDYVSIAVGVEAEFFSGKQIFETLDREPETFGEMRKMIEARL